MLLNQENQKKKLLNDKNIYIGIIYKDVLQHKSLKDIHKDLYRAIINPNKILLQYNLMLAKKIKRLDKGPGKYYEGIGLSGLAIDIVNYLSVNQINNIEHKIINREIRREEDREKNRILNDSLEETIKDGKVFFVASAHGDCAADHLAAQGKIYIDQNWRSILSGQIKDDVDVFIKQHNIDTMQYIINAPVYFITRPNCRHYFVRYSASDILKGNYKIPYHKIGPRNRQTPSRINYEYYSDRLELYQRLNKFYKTKEMDSKIVKTKILIKKWKKR